jgi:hypothetical protein
LTMLKETGTSHLLEQLGSFSYLKMDNGHFV